MCASARRSRALGAGAEDPLFFARAGCMNAFFRAGTTVFGLAFVAIGVALLVVTAVHGGGAVGFLLGALFIAAGVGRLYLLRRGS
jgi:hypothetical protein